MKKPRSTYRSEKERSGTVGTYARDYMIKTIMNIARKLSDDDLGTLYRLAEIYRNGKQAG